jgi:hypothetical protein
MKATGQHEMLAAYWFGNSKLGDIVALLRLTEVEASLEIMQCQRKATK